MLNFELVRAIKVIQKYGGGIVVDAKSLTEAEILSIVDKNNAGNGDVILSNIASNPVYYHHGFNELKIRNLIEKANGKLFFDLTNLPQ